ncbi:MAG TPA: hypothetical protein VF541_04845, partial [Longimicrobium sp.]
QIRRLVDAMMGKVREGGDAAELLAQARRSVGELLGPLAGIAPRMDSATAGQMVGDADVLGAWAEVTAAEAEMHRAKGDDSAAAAAARRALELSLEAHLRTTTDRTDLLSLVARLRPQVDAAALAPRHRDALAGITESPPS